MDAIVPTADRPTLLTLPPELRNRIYSYAIAQDQPIKLLDQKDELEFKEPPLMRSCRTLRKEAGAVFYSENTFTVNCRLRTIWNIDILNTIRLWEDGLGDFTNDVRTVEAEIELNEFEYLQTCAFSLTRLGMELKMFKCGHPSTREEVCSCQVEPLLNQANTMKRGGMQNSLLTLVKATIQAMEDFSGSGDTFETKGCQKCGLTRFKTISWHGDVAFPSIGNSARALLIKNN